MAETADNALFGSNSGQVDVEMQEQVMVGEKGRRGKAGHFSGSWLRALNASSM